MSVTSPVTGRVTGIVTSGVTRSIGRRTRVDSPIYQILVKTDNDGTSTDTQFTLPATGTYDIDWGDGTVEEKTGAATHTYDEAGEYVIKVTGGLTRILFNNGGDRLKLLEVQNWGDATWSSFNAAYWGCANCLFNATDALVLPGDCTRAFQNCTAFNQSVGNFNTAAVEIMFRMLAGCTSFNQSVANFDTAAVTNMVQMFNSCTAFNQSVANFNTAAVTNMESMFRGSTSFKQSVATFSLVGLNATDRLDDFALFTNINATDTTTNYDATLIAWAAQLPLAHGFAQSPNFGTAQYSAGAAATARAELVAAGWTITDGGITDPTAYQILVKTDNAGTSTDTQFTLPATGTYDIDWGDGTVEEKTGAATHTYDEAGEYVIKVTGGLTRITFNNGGDRLKLLEVQNWGDAVWSSFNAAYRGCENCLFNATDALVLPVSCSLAFTNCTAFNQSVANFNTAAVMDMSFMFFGCAAFNQSVANFNTAAVTDMSSMFSGCAAFKQSLATFSLAGLAATNRLDNFATSTNINTTSTTTNYDATLIAWAAQLPLAHGFAQSPSFGTAKYSAGDAADAKAALVTAGWTITDGGEAV